jgi:hypothetical protein
MLKPTKLNQTDLHPIKFKVNCYIIKLGHDPKKGKMGRQKKNISCSLLNKTQKNLEKIESITKKSKKIQLNRHRFYWFLIKKNKLNQIGMIGLN